MGRRGTKFRAGGEDENGRGRPQGAGGGARVHRAGPAAGLPHRSDEAAHAQGALAADFRVNIFALSIWFCRELKYQNIIEVSKYRLY